MGANRRYNPIVGTKEPPAKLISEYQQEYGRWLYEGQQKTMRPPIHQHISNVPMEVQTTYSTAYAQKGLPSRQKVSPKRHYKPPTKPVETLSTYKQDFIKKDGSRAASFKPDYVYVPHEAKMQKDTIYTMNYRAHELDDWSWCRAAPIRHRENLGKEEGPFHSTTTMRNDFRQFENMERAQPIKPVPENDIGGGQFDGNTTYKQEFQAKQPVSAPAMHQRPTYKPNPVPFAGQSTTFAVYRPHPEAVREKSFKPRTEYQPCPEPFDSLTTATHAYQAWPVERHEKPQWALQKSYQPPTQSFEKHSLYQEEYQAPGTTAARAELQKPRGSGLKLAPSTDNLEPAHTLYQEQFVSYRDAQKPKSFKVVQEYQPPIEKVQENSVYQSEFQGRSCERSKPCIPTSNKPPEADKPMNFDTTYRETYHNRQNEVRLAAGVNSGVGARTSQISFYDGNMSNNASMGQDMPHCRVIVQRVAAGISSDRMSRPMVALRTPTKAEATAAMSRSKSVDRATFRKQQSQRKVARETVTRETATKTTSTSQPAAQMSSEPKPIRGGPRVKAVSVENILDDSSSYQTANTNADMIHANVAVTEAHGVSYTSAQDGTQDSAQNSVQANGDLVPSEQSDYGSAIQDSPAIEAY